MVSVRSRLLALSALLIMAAVQLFGWIEGLATGQGGLGRQSAHVHRWGRSAAAVVRAIHTPRAATSGEQVVAIVGLAAGLLPAASAESNHQHRLVPNDRPATSVGRPCTTGVGVSDPETRRVPAEPHVSDEKAADEADTSHRGGTPTVFSP